LTVRTNNALVQSFVVNSLNELTNITRSGTLTVSGKTSSQATNVTINGLSAVLYGDSTFATNGFTVTNGLNSFTAVAADAFGHADTNTISTWLPASTTFLYDWNGNLTYDGTNNYAYDDENQLVSAWQTNNWRTDFLYDGKLRMRIKRELSWVSGAWATNSETRYVYDGMLVIQERDGTNNVQVNYTRGNDLSGSLQGAGGIGGLLARTDYTQPLQTGFYHCDGNGNITALVSPFGSILASYLYDPYGRTLAQSGPLADANVYRFSSKMWHDRTALYYYGYRFYSPDLQRWLNRDPIEEEGGVNIYEFTANNPLNLFDPFGLDADPTVEQGLQMAEWKRCVMRELGIPFLVSTAGEHAFESLLEKTLKQTGAIAETTLENLSIALKVIGIAKTANELNAAMEKCRKELKPTFGWGIVAIPGSGTNIIKCDNRVVNPDPSNRPLITWVNINTGASIITRNPSEVPPGMTILQIDYGDGVVATPKGPRPPMFPVTLK
jgi:RHS repeat-associated protein